MPWTKTDYPDSMKYLPPPVRNKAIEIANALLKAGKMEEGILIATAINRAKDWAAGRGIVIEEQGKRNSSDVIGNGEDRYVIPYGEREWAVKTEGKKMVEYIFHSKRKAVALAASEAKKARSSLIIQKRGGGEKRITYSPKKGTKKIATGKLITWSY